MTTDVYDAAIRSRVMRAVKSKNTRPEKLVRSLLHALGYRFRLHRRDLPGSPDIVFPTKRAVIFVHGCFWHVHDCPRGGREPKINAEYWRLKRAHNIARDNLACYELKERGWRVLVLWECEIKNHERLLTVLNDFLQPA